MTPRESEDARFRELMEREFPDGLIPGQWSERPRADTPPPDADRSGPDAAGGASPSAPSGSEPAAPTAAPAEPAAPVEPAAPDPGFRSWTPADEPEEKFVPPSAPPARRWTPAGIIGTAGVALPLLLVLLTAFGVQLPMLVSVLAGLGFFTGVALLLHRLRKRPPTDGDGAVV